jgi:hypothetical protein
MTTEFDPPGAHQESTMKIIASLAVTEHPPLLTLAIHDAPHRRMHIRTIMQYREFFRNACARAGIATNAERVCAEIMRNHESGW